MWNFSLTTGWTEIDDILEDGDRAPQLEAQGWEEYTHVGTEKTVEIWKHKDGRYLICLSTVLNTADWMMCENFPAMVELQSKLANIASARHQMADHRRA